MDRRKLLTVILILLFGITSWLLLQQGDEQEAGPTSQLGPHTPDYHMENFTITTMGLDGKAEKELTADRMEHFPDDDTTELTYPNIVIYDDNNPPWKIRSENGWLSGDGETLLLTGMVTIDREAGPNIRPMHIITSELRVRPNENYAETDQHVTIHSLYDEQESDGMQAWLEKPIRLKFSPNVRGRYEIN